VSISWTWQPVRSLVTGNEDTPVGVNLAKTYLRVSTSADDTLIGRMLETATLWAESYTRRAFLTQTWDFSYRGWFTSARPLWIPNPPLQSITSVKYYDEDGALQTLGSSNYVVFTQSGPRAGKGRVEIADGISLPSVSSIIEYPIVVRAVCGYGNDDDVPVGIGDIVLFMVGEMYEQRQETITGTISAKTQMYLEKRLAPYVVKDAI